MSRKGGTGGDGWVNPKVQTAWLCLGLAMRALDWSWVGHFFCSKHKWAQKNSPLALYSLQFLCYRQFSARQVSIAQASISNSWLESLRIAVMI